jgi:hypothetical protein
MRMMHSKIIRLYISAIDVPPFYHHIYAMIQIACPTLSITGWETLHSKAAQRFPV